MQTISSETENLLSTLNGKQQYGLFYLFIYCGIILVANGSILNLQFCVNMLHHAVNISHA